ncbi:hypothetical protein AKJ57_03255, partial [candidate division MSBL1 archaeon SCGC-AAA259A05]
ETSSYRIQFTNQKNIVRVENFLYSISEVKPTDENKVELVLESHRQVEGKLSSAAPSLPENEKGAGLQGPKSPSSAEVIKSTLRPIISQKAYNLARDSSGTIILSRETKHDTSLWPISASLGVAASLLFAAAWLSRREAIGNATSMLIERGLENMSIRDAEIVGEIMRREEFTIPQLMEKTGTSKITTWRTVKKLVEEGFVRKTEKTRAPSKGLGGRGKPSQVYEYVGPEQKE